MPPSGRKSSGGGVGGTATEYSPFDPVDAELRVAGGVGGTATEYTISPAGPTGFAPPKPAVTKPRFGAAKTLASTSGPAFTVSGGVCTAVAAPWSSALEQECRPGLIVRTALGTLMRNVPVSWNVGLGGGSIAAETPVTRACGVFGATTSGSTDTTGRAGICWILGAELGTNTAVATPSVGGDAPPSVTFVPATTTFTATAIKRTPTTNITCADAVYNAANQALCSATVVDPFTAAALTPFTLAYALTAAPATPVTPHDAGDYTGTVSYVETAKYFANSASAAFHITKATPVVSLTCPTAPVLYNGADQPALCSGATAAGVGTESSLTPVTLTYALTSAPATPVTPNIPGNYTATAAFAATTNYFAASHVATFDIVKATPVVGIACPTAPAAYTGAPQLGLCTVRRPAQPALRSPR